MRLKNKEDIDSYNKGIELAHEILSILESKSEKSNLKEFPHILDWINNNPYSEDLIKKLSSEKELKRSLNRYNNNAAQQVKRFYRTIERQKFRRKALKTVISISGIAAIIILSLVLSLKQKTFITVPQTTSFASVQEITEPTLILKTGERIEIDNNNYPEQLESISQTIDPVLYNKLVIPPKCKFKLELEDGSTVFLNADSELSYPINFTGETREVILHRGEAYFEIKKDKRAFQVVIDNAKINVYGTKFNANFYSPQKIETVLFEGSLGVSFNDANETLINPGELITIDNSTGDKKIERVNTRNYLTWLNGFVSCDEEPLLLLLEQVSRWYDIQFLIDPNVNTNILVTAYFSIERPLDEILKSIEDITTVKFTKKDGGKYMVE